MFKKTFKAMRNLVEDKNSSSTHRSYSWVSWSYSEMKDVEIRRVKYLNFGNMLINVYILADGRKVIQAASRFVFGTFEAVIDNEFLNALKVDTWRLSIDGKTFAEMTEDDLKFWNYLRFLFLGITPLDYELVKCSKCNTYSIVGEDDIVDREYSVYNLGLLCEYCYENAVTGILERTYDKAIDALPFDAGRTGYADGSFDIGEYSEEYVVEVGEISNVLGLSWQDSAKLNAVINAVGTIYLDATWRDDISITASFWLYIGSVFDDDRMPFLAESEYLHGYYDLDSNSWQFSIETM